MKKVGKIIGNILFYLVLISMILICFTMLRAKKMGVQPSVMGHKFYTVLTGSMSPTIEPGDLVIVKETPANEIKEGDIITFASSQSDNITTHRVKQVIKEDEIKFVTKGDANNVEDPNPVSEQLLVGRVVKHIGGLGSKMQYMQKNLNKIIIAIIVIAVGLTGVSVMVRKINKYDDSNKDDK